MDMDNITQRRTKTAAVSPNISFMSTQSETLSKSLPDLSTGNVYNDETEEMTEEIDRLQRQLQIAHAEIDTLNLENVALKKRNIEQDNIIKKLKTICTDSVTSSKKSTIKSKRKHQRKTLNKNNLNVSCADLGLPLDEDLTTNTTIKEISINGTTINNNSVNKNKIVYPKIPQVMTKPNKICIVSTNDKNKVLPIAETTFSNQFQLCHYLKPGGGTMQLLDGLQSKLAGFTMTDYCIIFLGDEDFKTTQNYVGLILNIRKALRGIEHTNIIICLPTFILENFEYNWRIETFNNLLYLDVSTHGHALLLDSNLNLKYDNSMFNRSGGINNFGLHTIFKDIFNLITDLPNYIRQSSGEDISNDDNKDYSQFFRD